jgi:ribokinase
MTNNRSINRNLKNSPYQVMIGTGGVGHGSFFALEGNKTLGREESRAGRLLGRKDYCKLHIISHYVKVLLGANFEVIPASKVGDDVYGHKLLDEMKEVGLVRENMEVSTGSPTLFSLCFVYPDGSGGNLTTSDAANSLVDPTFIQHLEPSFIRWRGHGVALAAPEVPLPARLKLLELASQYGFFRVACLTGQEARSDLAHAIIAQSDLLAVNLNEAAALAGVPDEGLSAAEIARAAHVKVGNIQPAILLSVTSGKLGSWCWDGTAFTNTPVVQVEAVSTAGAGDAHLAGVIAGLVAGVSLRQAHQFGSLVAALSITSADTIHKGLDRNALLEFANQREVTLDPVVRVLLSS